MMHRTVTWILIVCGALMGAPAFGAARGEASSIEPRADKILRQMTEYLKNLEQFSFHAENTGDRILDSGQKLQFARAVEVSVRRPNRFRAVVKGDLDNQQLSYDGKTITLFEPDRNYYATIKAPPNIDAALDHALESFSLRAPFSDLIYSNLYDILTENVVSGFYVGLHSVHGIETHHLAFRQDDIDWQVWIESSETPLPRKIIITEKRVAGAPQFTAVFSDWNVSPQLRDSVFTFVAPDKAERIEFLPVEKSAFPGQ